MLSAYRWSILTGLCTALLVGGSLTAYITPGDFLESQAPPLVPSSAPSLTPLPPLPALFAQAASSTSSTLPLPTLFPQPSSAASSVLLPVLPGASSAHAGGGGGGNTGGGGGGGRGMTIVRSSERSTSTWFPNPAPSPGAWSDTFPPAGTAVAPAYDAYYERIAGSALHEAVTTPGPVTAAAPLQPLPPPSSAPLLSSAPSASSAPPVAVAALPAAPAPPSAVTAAVAPGVHAGAVPLPASGAPYLLTLLLILPAAWLVLRSVRRAERW